MLDQAIHACDADSGQEPPDRRRDETDEERHEHRDRDGHAAVRGKGEERGDDHDEEHGETDEQDFEGDLVGVFCLFALSTMEIMWSRKVSPGLAVIITFMRPERMRVPPVTALRSPFPSLMTGADSPVTADSSTRATPSTISPSPGTGSPSSMITMSPFLKERAGTFSIVRPPHPPRICLALGPAAGSLPAPFPCLRQGPRRSWQRVR